MRFLGVAGAAFLLCNCAGLNLQLVDGSVQKPSNVAVYFSLRTREGKPVPGLTAEQFKIYEDGKIVSPFESKQTILNPEVAAIQYTLLLVDMSGSVTESGSLPSLEEAVKSFATRVGGVQQTAVYAFDGRPEIVQLSGFSSSPHVSLAGFHSKDPSTNLNGAVVQAMKVLRKQLEHSTVPLRFATLVVFTDGTDHAQRVTHAELMRALGESNDLSVFVIGVGAEIDQSELSAIGRDGTALSKDPGATAKAFDDIANRIEGFTKSFYLLSYCSPARAGEHDLTVEPVLADGQAGSLTYHFNAAGFGPNCDPKRNPNFDVRHPKLAPGMSP